MRFWLYKLTYDNGGAPCAFRSVLSLAICKPRIREWARPGDWIVGFGGRSRPQLRGERLIYMAEVAERLTPCRYYEDAAYAGRPDCIYERKGDGLVWKPGSRFHLYGSGVARDLGPEPHYPKANVLLSTNFRYLGAAGTEDYKAKHPALAAAVEAKGVGQSAYEPGSTIGRELAALQRELWREHADRRVLGHSTEPPEQGGEYVDAGAEGQVATRRGPGCSGPRTIVREHRRRGASC
ncbi:hypothetical protein [Anaeromyxobacter diazotrophicus]|uniref:Nucleotide modification associated domain-containing protein n=1 Tax=Anaeromyxobacter diazotrophicus TaxID=2590199 RepID=A0A7I9VJM7_9BACT|nr:hypothetical protein [Anaeromyxobacter diazotrophicus]GEJ56612.1 hypothetical protein AMYX_13530 [Anaeromyxobacter diazotrophicus]